jgi:isopropylmalate/homocitrate/citramalate synthase
MAKKYDINFLKEVSEKLIDIPDYNNEYNNNKTLTESIEILKPTIKSLSKKGYKSSLIAELLTNNGIEANQQYLQKLIQKILLNKKKQTKKSEKDYSKSKLNIKNNDNDKKKSNSFTINDDSKEL